jgi:hypothetical protein
LFYGTTTTTMTGTKKNLKLLAFVLAFLRANGFTVPITTGLPRAFQSAGTSASSQPIRSTTTRTTVLHDRPPKIIFSDIDGSLVHYEKNTGDNDNKERDDTILALPPSATGMKGIISFQTLALCRELRQKGVKLVLVSGMRTSTLLNRLPYLPKADAYCTEAGGRIFYPTEVINEEDEEVESPFQQWSTVEIPGDDSDIEDDYLKAFGLREDRTWRERMELVTAAGGDGYAGNEVFSDRCEGIDDDEECLIDYENPFGFPKQQDVIPTDQRKGSLWKFAQELQQEGGFVLDTKSYSTCFRVNRKHQTGAAQDKFQGLLNGDIVHPVELGKSTNLGCIDYYPITSGKRNW